MPIGRGRWTTALRRGSTPPQPRTVRPRHPVVNEDIRGPSPSSRGPMGGMCLQAGGRVEGPALGVGPVSAARKGECTARKRLLERMVRWVPVRFDHVVVDSHYSGTPFLEPPGRSGLAVLVRLTDKLAELVEATQAGVRGTSASAIYRFDGGVVEVWDPSIFEQCWWTPRSPAWPWGWSGSTACITSTGPAAQTPATPPPRSPHSLEAHCRMWRLTQCVPAFREVRQENESRPDPKHTGTRPWPRRGLIRSAGARGGTTPLAAQAGTVAGRS
jgi:hypothetical protein